MEKHRLKAAELQNELEKIRRQYNNEKMEREAALAELKRYAQILVCVQPNASNLLAVAKNMYSSRKRTWLHDGCYFMQDASSVEYFEYKPSDGIDFRT